MSFIGISVYNAICSVLYYFPMRAICILGALRYVTDTLLIWEHENTTPIGTSLPIMGEFLLWSIKLGGHG